MPRLSPSSVRVIVGVLRRICVLCIVCSGWLVYIADVRASIPEPLGPDVSIVPPVVPSDVLADAEAPRRGQGQRGRQRGRRSRYVTIPVDIGIGPSAHLITGPVFRDQPVLTGLSLSVQAIIDKQTIRKYRKRIPARYRKLAQQMNEVRYSPFIWLPETLFISPALPRRLPDGSKRGGTGMYGATWRPFSIGIPWLQGGVKFTTSAGARLTYAFLHSDTAGGGLESPTHFLRIGIDLRAQLYVPFSDEVGVSLGWTSQFYPPQPVGGSIFAFGPFDESIWHIGQGTLKLHVRVPYRTQL